MTRSSCDNSEDVFKYVSCAKLQRVLAFFISQLFFFKEEFFKSFYYVHITKSTTPLGGANFDPMAFI
jgi:hypothetical protein